MRLKFILLFLLCLCFFWADICVGSVTLSVSELLDKQSDILWQIRLPKALTALFVGSTLASSGLLMQTLFRNPLAGPYVLGISSGATLGVAVFLLLFYLLGISMAFFQWGIILFGIIGAFGLMAFILLISLRVNDSVTLLVAGMMLGGVSSSIVNILQHLSDAHHVKYFVNWTLGSLANVTWEQLEILCPILTITILLSLFLLKSMDVLLLGEEYAQSVGVKVSRLRFQIILVTVIQTALCTAFAGPIGFVGIAVPHVTRRLFDTSRHRVILPACLLLGSSMMLLCDLLSHLPSNGYVLPINAVTSLMGIPIVLWIIFGRTKMVV